MPQHEPTEEQKEFLIAWIVRNVDAGVVPCDEGNTEGLIYNLVNLVRHGPDFQDGWTYAPAQRAEVEAYKAKYGRIEG